MRIILSNIRLATIGELFTNLAAGFFGSLIVFPGLFGIHSVTDIAALLFINLPSGILCLLISFRLKEIAYA